MPVAVWDVDLALCLQGLLCLLCLLSQANASVSIAMLINIINEIASFFMVPPEYKS
jgi:hypothetical protein